jgi:hypothetical protein
VPEKFVANSENPEVPSVLIPRRDYLFGYGVSEAKKRLPGFAGERTVESEPFVVAVRVPTHVAIFWIPRPTTKSELSDAVSQHFAHQFVQTVELDVVELQHVTVFGSHHSVALRFDLCQDFWRNPL